MSKARAQGPLNGQYGFGSKLDRMTSIKSTSLFEIVVFLGVWFSDLATWYGLWAGGGEPTGLSSARRRNTPPAAVLASGDRDGGLASLRVVLETVRFSGESPLGPDPGLPSGIEGLSAGVQSAAAEVAQSIPEITCDDGDDTTPFTTWRHFRSSSVATGNKCHISKHVNIIIIYW